MLLFLADRPPDAEWKEVLIGHLFFGRSPDYDPKLDPIVRTEVRRLRSRLEQYYEEEGRGDDWRLDIPKGGYLLISKPVPRRAAPSALAPVPVTEAVPVESASSKARWISLASAIAALVVLGVGAYLWSHFQPATIRTVSVLPLTIDSQAQMPGLGDSIAAALSQTHGLRVVRGSAADAVLSGQAKVWNGRLKLHLQLERTSDKSLAWAKDYERDLVDPFSLEEELSVSAAYGIGQFVSPGAKSKRSPSAASAREAQRGWKLMERTSAPSLREALEAFRNAARLDAENANAWAGICEVIASAPDYMSTPPEWTEEARTVGQKALALEPDNIEALAALGWLEYSRELRAARAERMLKQAQALDPNNLRVRRRLAMVWMGMGRFKQAEQQIRTAIELDPLSLIAKINLAEVYCYQSDFPHEEQVLREVLKAQPNYVLGRMMLAVSLTNMKRCGEAMPIVRLLQQEPDAAGWDMSLVSLEARCGNPAPARKYLDRSATDPTAWSIAYELREWPEMYRGFEKLSRELPSSARIFSLGPERSTLLTYPPLARLIAEIDEKVRRPD